MTDTPLKLKTKKHKKKNYDTIEDISSNIQLTFKSLNYKHLLLMIIVIIFITHETFVTRVMGRIHGTQENGVPTFKGSMVQITTFAILYIIALMIVSSGIL